MKKVPLVSIVILNWNGTDDTLRCLESVEQLDYPKLETIVLDNGSSEDISRLRDITSPAITLIEKPRNLGFTGGELAALPYCHGEFILILNNDAIIDKSTVTEALKVFAKDKKIAAVGGRSYLLDDNGGKMGIFHYTHQRIDPVTAEVHTYTKDDNEEQDVSNISGACVLIRKSAINQVGYFDKSFFAYYEETDLFSRFRRAGLRVVFSPRVIIWHKMGASTRNKKYMYNYLIYKNQFFFAYKNFDSYYLRLFKKAYRKHFFRALMIIAKRLGRVPKHDIIHKARVDAYLKTLVSRPQLWLARKNTLKSNPNFNLNEVLFTDTPLPISIFVDATTISTRQASVLNKNLDAIQSLNIRPAEIVVVSKKPLSLPSTTSLVRFANVIDNGRNGLAPLDYFFMCSNHDLLLLSKSSTLLDKPLTKKELALFESSVKRYYISAKAKETVAILGSNTKRRVITPAFLKTTPYEIIGLSKQTLVNHLAEDSMLFTIDANVLSDTVGRSVAQCIHTESHPISPLFGYTSGAVTSAYEPILDQPIRWLLKYALTTMHVWGITVKVLRKAGLVKNRATKTIHDHTPITIDKDIPIIFNTRDRYEPLQKMVDWLTERGYTNIIFVDNDSTYPPLLDLFKNRTYQHVPLGRNAMHKAPWESMAVRFFTKGRPYIVSDPDITPDTTCPDDAINYLAKLLNKYPLINKAGLGLRIDNIPSSNRQREDIIAWESRFWDRSIELQKNVFNADLDTTFALYRPLTWWFLSPSIRTGGNYVAIHEPWYQASDNPTDDFLYYKMRASREVSTWGLDALPKHHLRALKKEGFIDEIIEEDE